jgi:hypothetical protein
LVRGTGGLAGEVADLRRDIAAEFAASVAMAVEEWTDPAAADPNAIKVSFASSDAAQSFSGADLDGVVGTGVMDPPRNITITTSVSTDIDAVDVVITGLDINGNAQTDTITLTADVGATDVGTKAFSSVSQIDIPAQTGNGGLIEVGFGSVIGLSKPLLSRAGAEAVMMEIEDGTVLAADVITGTFVDAATSGPNGTYAPATIPDASNDYAVYYEYDASQNS